MQQTFTALLRHVGNLTHTAKFNEVGGGRSVDMSGSKTLGANRRKNTTKFKEAEKAKELDARVTQVANAILSPTGTSAGHAATPPTALPPAADVAAAIAGASV